MSRHSAGKSIGLAVAVVVAGTALAGDKVRVGVYEGGGARGAGAVEWARMVDDSPEMALTVLDSADVTRGALDNLDLFIMPGGSARAEAASLGPENVERLRAFIRNGGAYMGSCAGAIFMLDGRTGMIPYVHGGSEKSTVMVNLERTDACAKALGVKKGLHLVRYHGGPFMYPGTNVIEGASFEVWDRFACEGAGKGRVNPKMYGAVATLAGTYGKGRVIITACHPESLIFSRLDFAFPCLRWLTRRPLTFPPHARGAGALAVAYYNGDAATWSTNVKTVLGLLKRDDLDVTLVERGSILYGALDHADVLVLPDLATKTRDSFLKDETLGEIVNRFCIRGGKCVAWGEGRKVLPPAVRPTEIGSVTDVLPALRKLFPEIVR